MRQRFWVAVAFAYLVGVAVSASAQTPFRHSGVETKHSTYSPLPNEHIDPASGALTLVATDLVLPGNAGFDLRVTRIYNSSLYPEYDSGSTALDEDSWAGVGWRLHFGRVLNPYATTGGATTIEMGDGSRHPLYTTTAYPEGWMSPGFARYDRTAHTLKLPNGFLYTFGHEVSLGGTLGVVRYVTEIRDPFNNRLEFSYFAAPGPLDGLSQIRQYLSATQVREVNFTYDSALKTLATMSYDGRTWTYVQTAQGSSGHSLLREVRAPLGPPELYDYAALPGELTRWETPAGGVTTYTYQDAYRTASTVTNRTRVVTQRAVSGRLVTPGTWTFAYSTGTNQDTTTISCACGTTTYRFNGVGLSGDFSAWKSGTLAEQTVAEPGGPVLETRTFTWTRSEMLSPDAVPGQGGVWADAAVYGALLQSATVTRGAQSWTTSYEYHTASFNDFGQPWKVTETGQFTRVSQTTFQTGFTPHMVGRPASTSVQVGPETVTATWTYDLATGFVTSFVGPGSPLRTFVARPDGNLASEKDARNNITTYENYTWGKPQIVRTPKTVTTLSINADGTVASAGNAVVVTFTYDALFRPKSTSSYGVNPVLAEYDNVAGSGGRSERGTAYAGVTADGFGRPVLQYASSAVKARTAYDACGRPVSARLPYTSGQPNVIGTPGPGSTTTYDALGRVKTVTGPDGAVTQFAYAGIDVTVTDAKLRPTVYDYSAAGDPGAARLAGVTDAAGVTTTYGYDVLDNLVRVSGPGPIPDRTWSYSSLGLRLSDTQPESGQTTYQYDAAGNLTQTTDAKNQTVVFTYDEDNRLVTVNAPGTADDVALTYDTYGRLTSQSAPGAGITYAYNAAGQLASRTDTVGALTFVSSYTYDLNENLKTVTYPSGRVVTYDYDAHNRLTTVKQNGVVFADQFAYDGGGRLASYRTGTVTHTLGYDVAGRTQALTSGGALNLTYGYDPVGNVTSITEPAQTAQQFTYDALDRLQSATGAWGQRSWTYNASGDRTSEIGPGATSYTYDAATRRLLSTSGTRAESFTYSPIGEVTSDGRGSYTYNSAGLVTQFAGPNVTATYAYDPAGLRTSKTVNGVTTYTLRSSGGTVLSEFRSLCGSPVWTRDILHAGGRLLGSIKAVTAEPTVTFMAATATATEAQGTLTATVQLVTPWSGGSPCPITVSYEALMTVPASGTTATTPADFVLASGSLTFPAGSLNGATQTISVGIVNDPSDEESETFSLALTAATGAAVGAIATQVVTVTDDDPPPTLAISDASVSEGNSGTSQLVFTVSVSQVSGKPITVSYATTAGTATAGSDFVAASGSLTIPPGTASVSLTIDVLGDQVDEPAEQFTVTLSAPTNATFADSAGIGTIVDDDPTVLSVSNVTTKAGQVAQFTLTLTIPAETTITVQYATANGTAVAGTDYQAASGTATFPVGTATRTIAITTIADAPEADETFSLQLSAPVGAVLSQTSVTGTIVNRRKGDLNGDGKPDLLWQHTDGRLLAWLMNGTTATSWPELSPNNAGAGWEVVGMGDFSGDGYQDLLMQHTNGSLQVWALQDTQRTAVLSLSLWGLSDTNWKIRAVGDFNSDQKPDIVWQHLTSDHVAVWLMNGLTLLSSELTSPSTIDADVWKIVGAGDVNGDGKTDLFWQDQAAGWLAAWTMNGLTLIDSLSLSPPQLTDLQWKIRAAGDYNNDGKPDLLWHHQTDQWVAAWLMNGTTLVTSLYLTPDQVDPAAWRLVGPR